MKTQTCSIATAALCLAAFAGCQDQSPESPQAGSDRPPAVAQSEQAGVESEVTVNVASWSEVQDIVASHRGKVVVVDLWSTWCVPCMREFPNLVKLQKQFPDQVACISVNLNYDGSDDAPPQSHRDEVLKFLTRQNASFQNIICSDPDEMMYDKLDLGSIPAIYVYDKQGNVHRRFDNDAGEYGEEGFTYEQHVIPLVKELIGT
jgi:thiol-disulfide isomerase/thioredoxin